MQNIKIVNKAFLHFGRVTAYSLMDMVEVKHVIKRDIGNWKNDTYDNHYSSKLPLFGMRVMTGFDGRRSYHYNTRANFFGEDKHEFLSLMIFTFIENKLDMLRSKKGLSNSIRILRVVTEFTLGNYSRLRCSY